MTPLEEGMRGELGEVLELIRQAGGGVLFEDYPGAIEDCARVGPTRDNSSPTRPTLIEQANDLAERLERIRPGEVGI
jgi:hypothetical protein